jgi:hypothetical protein
MHVGVAGDRVHEADGASTTEKNIASAHPVV